MPWFVMTVPFLAFTMPIQALFFFIDPLSKVGKIGNNWSNLFGAPDDSKVMKLWNWLSLATNRYFMPYTWLGLDLWLNLFGLSPTSNYSGLNIRNMDNTTAGVWFLINWFFIPLTWTQAVVNFFLTSPFYIVAIPWKVIEMFV